MGKRFLIWSNPRDALVHLTYFLILLGGVNIFSASFVAAGDMFGNGYHYLIRYFIYGAVGLVLMHWIGRKWDYHKVFRYNQIFCAGCTAGECTRCLIFTPPTAFRATRTPTAKWRRTPG